MLRLLFFLKQKAADEMRISGWSSDVCSSDLEGGEAQQEPRPTSAQQRRQQLLDGQAADVAGHDPRTPPVDSAMRSWTVPAESSPAFSSSSCQAHQLYGGFWG